MTTRRLAAILAADVAGYSRLMAAVLKITALTRRQDRELVERALRLVGFPE
jgi:class 3 adenylate cyclase